MFVGADFVLVLSGELVLLIGADCVLSGELAEVGAGIMCDPMELDCAGAVRVTDGFALAAVDGTVDGVTLSVAASP